MESEKFIDDAAVYAWLEEKGYKKWEIDKLDRWYVNNIIKYPRDKHGGLQFKFHYPEKDDYLDDKQKFYRAYKDWDYPDWVINRDWVPQQTSFVDYDEQQRKAYEEIQKEQKRAQGRQ